MRDLTWPGRKRLGVQGLFSAAILSASVGTPLSGCSASDADGLSTDPNRVSVVDSGGVSIVTNQGTGWASDEAWRLEPDLQVGEIDGPLAFGRVSWVGPGPDGGLLVLDAQSHLVHVFDSEGRTVLRFGGEGEGPGEFRRPASVVALEDGRFAVGQGFPPVLHWLDAEGEYLHSTRLPIARDEAGTRTAGSFGIWQVTAKGRVFVQAQLIDPGASEDAMPVVLLEVDPATDQPPDTIESWTWQAGFGDRSIRVFDPVHTWSPRSDGVIVLSTGSPYEIEWHDPEHGLERKTRRQVEPVAVSARHRDFELDRMREGMAAGGASESAVEDLLGRVEFGSTIPEVLRVWVSEPDGRLWIGVHDSERFAAAESPPSGGWANALDVFEADGRYLGRIPIPVGFRLRVVTEDALYGVWEDALEVPFARRYRIERPS
jgi:hypothetical protein